MSYTSAELETSIETDPTMPSQNSGVESPTISTGAMPLRMVSKNVIPILLGKVMVEGYAATVLFNTSVSHSFIAESFVHAIGLPTVKIDVPYLLATPLGVLSILNINCEAVVTLLNEFPTRNISFSVPLKVTNNPDYDLALGMDWLVESQAMIDFEHRRISVYTPRTGREWFMIEDIP